MNLTKLTASILFSLCSLSLWALDEGEYYIYNDFFEKALTNDGTTPMLGAMGTDDSAFIFEAVNKSGDYVMLRQKSTGKYLTASTSNTWSVLFSSEGSGDQYYWKLEQQFSTTIVSKKNTNKRLGCDFNSGSTYFINETYVPLYYDKSAGAMNWFTIIPANGNGFVQSRKYMQTAQFTNEYGVVEQDDYCVTEPVQVEGIDYHVISATPFSGGKVNLVGTNSWVVFENIRPSKLKTTYLKYVTINGQTAVSDTNCRVEMYLRGSVVIPLPEEDPFVATTDEGTFSVKLGNTKDLGENSNKARSFTLKRGYMATVATGTSGSEYSRVYVADHKDLNVTLPKALDLQISSVYVRNWHYTAKSGYCSTKGDVATATTACGGSWFWNWDASKTSTSDAEYIPIKQHIYWPSDANFDKAGSTAMMLFNEPEHSEQHSNCDCGGTISSWTAYTNTTKFNSTGLRIGSPSATDLSYIKEYDDYCYNMKQRCDFNCTHGYWSSEWSSNLSTLKGYGRPIWITEWEYGASWTSGTNPSSSGDAQAKVLNILDMLEYNDYVEHYSYYEFDTGGTNGWMREMFYDNTYTSGLAYVGSIYAKVKPHLGYKSSIQPVANWWAPTFVAPSITSVTLNDGKYVLTVKNDNTDATKAVTVLKQNGNLWETIATITDRSQFDASTLSIPLEAEDLGSAFTLKVAVTSIFTDDTKESETFSREYKTLDGLRNLLFDEGTCIDKTVLTYAKDIKDANAQTSGVQQVEGWTSADTGDSHSGAQYAYGTSYGIGTADFTAPATNSLSTKEGGCLGVLACWTSTTHYTQDVILPAGDYTLTFAVYNAGGTSAMAKNLCGLTTSTGDEYYSTQTTYPEGWSTDAVKVSLTSEVLATLSLGYTADNLGSAKNPHLFFDYMKISDGTHTWPLSPEEVSVSAPSSSSVSPSAYYSASGVKSSHPHQGLNIIRMNDGRAKKVMKK